MDLARRQEELRWPPDEMFRHIKAPALALAGEKDLNVPPRHAARVAEIMGQAGNMEAVSAVIPGADHSFQQAPADEDERYRERYSFASFRRPYEPRLYQEVLAWLRRTVPTPATGGAVAARTVPPGLNERARDRTEVDPKTENTPQRIQLAPGVEIIDDITDRAKTAAVETLEGRIGPLLLAEGAQAHFIDMPAGMYVEEHPHKTESIIYTVKGRWVLCSKGRRHLMKPGSLFRFGRDIPTGYEVPFPENAFILIFKGDRTLKHEKEFIDYLKGMAERLKKEQKEGVPYLLKDLPADHAARKFARQVNPEFEK
jgi:quercetin dioxygenase-like cupin family protein